MKKKLILLVIVIFVLSGCSLLIRKQSIESIQCASAVKTGTIEEVDGDPLLIKRLTDKFKSGFFGKQHSLLISKNGKLVVEEYFRGWSSEKSHQVQSISKSFTSILLGDTIAKGYIDSINDPISKYLPKYKPILVGKKEKITIKDLLTMSAGLEWNELSTFYDNPENIRNREMNSTDSINFTLSLPIAHKRGKVFTYSGGYVTVIGEIIKNATGSKSIADFAIQSNLSHLCFKNAQWYFQKDGRQDTASGLFMRPRDMIKIGQLVLNDGIWNDEKIIDKSWIKESTNKHISVSGTWYNYGYYWWSRSFFVRDKIFRAIAALGDGGQKIIIIKDLDLVFVTTANNFKRQISIKHMMADFVIPAFM